MRQESFLWLNCIFVILSLRFIPLLSFMKMSLFRSLTIAVSASIVSLSTLLANALLTTTPYIPGIPHLPSGYTQLPPWFSLSGLTITGTTSSGSTGSFYFSGIVFSSGSFYIDPSILAWLIASGSTGSSASGSSGFTIPPYLSGILIPPLWTGVTLPPVVIPPVVLTPVEPPAVTPLPPGGFTPKPNLPFPDVTLFSKTQFCLTGGSTVYNLNDPLLLPFYSQFSILQGSTVALTRAQFLQIVLDFAGGNLASEISQIETKYYPDVTPTAWYRPYVNYATRHGIVSGGSDGNFYPDSHVTRAEATKILIHALGKDGTPFKGTFVDVPASHSLATFIESAYDHCFLNGKNTKDGKVIGGGGRIFGPNDGITGPEALKILYNMKY